MKNYSAHIISVLFLCSVKVNAQLPERISSVDVKKIGSNVVFTVSLLSPNEIRNTFLLYRVTGSAEYEKKGMNIYGSSAEYSIPSDEVKAGAVEYGIVIELKNNSTEAYPVGFPSAPPKQFNDIFSAKDKEVLILSPEINETVTSDNFFISLSLSRLPSNVNKTATKIFLNNIDLTKDLIFIDDLILYHPNKDIYLSGSYDLKVEFYDEDGSLYHSANSRFKIKALYSGLSTPDVFNYSAAIQSSSRSENVNSLNTLYNTLDINFNGSYEEWKITGSLFLNSEEKGNLQPQHRFNVGLKSDWLQLSYGDNFPRFPSLILEGKRVRGIDGSINYGIFNLQAAYGDINRAVQGRLLQLIGPSDGAALSSNVIRIDSAKYGMPFGLIDFGTYSRRLFAVRPSLNAGAAFQIGISYLHSIDDKNSVELASRPQENLVLGADISSAFDNQNIRFSLQSAFSLTNKDIAGGNITDAQLDSLSSSEIYASSVDDLKRIRDIASSFITVNQHLSPLNPGKLPTLAGEAKLALNYFDNLFNISYIYRGNEYQSFGQSFLRNDIRGINISDNIRLFKNQIMLRLSYENLEDNLQNTKPFTTKYQTINTSVSYFPGSNFPGVFLSFTRFDHKNNADGNDSLSQLYTINDFTNQYSINLSYSFKFGIQHYTSLSFTRMDREDNSIRKLDGSNNSISLSVNSTINNKLSSSVNLNYSKNRIAVNVFDYTAIYLGGKYIVNESLNLSSYFSQSFGSLNRQSANISAQYNLLKNLGISAQLSVIRYGNLYTNSVISFSTIYNI